MKLIMWIITWIAKLVHNGNVIIDIIMWILMSPCLHDAIIWSMVWTTKTIADMKTTQGTLMIVIDNGSPSMEDMVESHDDYGVSSMEANIHKPSYNNKSDTSSMESDSDYTLYTMRDVGHHHHSTPSKRDNDKLAKSRDATSSSRRRHKDKSSDVP